MTYTQKVPVRCRFLYSIKIGIIPPFTYMVITQNNDNWDLNIKRFLLTTNARSALVTRESSVQIIVLNTVM